MDVKNTSATKVINRGIKRKAMAMMVQGPRKIGILLCSLFFHLLGVSIGQGFDRMAVTYQTQDGWTIRGTLTLPKQAADHPVSAVLLLTEPVNRIRTTYNSTLASMLPQEGVAVLVIDVRGTGGSYGKKDFLKFTRSELDGLQLDIRGGLSFLASHPAVDGQRLAIVAPGMNANYALLEASENSDVRALVLITGTQLSRGAREYIQYRKDVPILCLVGSDQEKIKQRIEAEAYFLSENRNSGLLFGVQRGTNMMNRPGGLRERVTEWLLENLKALGTETPVVFSSSDQWNLHGTLFLPDGIDEESKVAGVVFVHGYNHSSEGWYQMARLVAKNGMASLTFDWRGTRKSADQERGEVGVNLSNEEREKIPLDVKASIEFLASQKGVDRNRIALVAATATNNHALRAAIGDSRVKTFVGLSFYNPYPDVKQFLESSDMPILIVASTEDVNAGPNGASLAESSKEIYRISKSKESQFLLYDDAGRGTGMIQKKPELEGMIIRWLENQL